MLPSQPGPGQKQGLEHFSFSGDPGTLRATREAEELEERRDVASCQPTCQLQP